MNSYICDRNHIPGRPVKKWRETEFQITKMLYTAAAKAATYIITRQCSA